LLICAYLASLLSVSPQLLIAKEKDVAKKRAFMWLRFFKMGEQQ
jgi:hypothetical protein